jgi:hypothetical protein
MTGGQTHRRWNPPDTAYTVFGTILDDTYPGLRAGQHTCGCPHRANVDRRLYSHRADYRQCSSCTRIRTLWCLYVSLCSHRAGGQTVPLGTRPATHPAVLVCQSPSYVSKVWTESGELQMQPCVFQQLLCEGSATFIRMRSPPADHG